MVHWKAPLPLLARPSAPPQLWRPIADDTVSSAATYDLTWPEDLALLWVRILGFVPVTNGVNLLARTSGDGGSTFDSGASDYCWQAMIRGSGLGFTNDAADSLWRIIPAGAGGDVGNAAGYGMWGDFYLLDPAAAKQTNMLSSGSYRWSGGIHVLEWQSRGIRLSAAKVDGLQLYFSSGNIDTGRVQVRGLLAHGAGS